MGGVEHDLEDVRASPIAKLYVVELGFIPESSCRNVCINSSLLLSKLKVDFLLDVVFNLADISKKGPLLGGI